MTCVASQLTSSRVDTTFPTRPSAETPDRGNGQSDQLATCLENEVVLTITVTESPSCNRRPPPAEACSKDRVDAAALPVATYSSSAPDISYPVCREIVVFSWTEPQCRAEMWPVERGRARPGFVLIEGAWTARAGDECTRAIMVTKHSHEQCDCHPWVHRMAGQHHRS
eukprot:3935672-Rhodomonas_salina.4